MTYTFDANTLDSITAEARQCFLEEDVPGYMDTLRQGMEQIEAGQMPDYKALMRAAHSIKGGAGVSQLPGITALAHKLEDLLEGFHQQRVVETDFALTLCQRGVAELEYLFSQISGSPTLTADPELLQELVEFNKTLIEPQNSTSSPQATGSSTLSPARLGLIKTALETDLEGCLANFEGILAQSASAEALLRGLLNFADEAMLLGEAFSIGWLVDRTSPLFELENQSLSVDEVKELGQQVVSEVRHQRDRFLSSLAQGATGAAPPSETPMLVSAPEDEVELIPQEGAIQGELAATTQLRIPLRSLEQMGSTVGELLTYHERLTLHQQQLRQASLTLRRLVEQVKPVRDEVQSLYDQMSVAGNQEAGVRIIRNSQGHVGEEFDTLEMDRYTALHSSLQTFEELITQIQEARVDIDLVSRELHQDLSQVRIDLDQLYGNVTQSRLVPFKTLAQRFVPQLRRINQRFGKQAELVIEGENVLVDKVLLEQLQTPLIHLLNNSLDHGIELPEERLALDKPATGRILLAARPEGSEMVITFQDDGRGIDLQRVYAKAIATGLCPSNLAFGDLRREEILEFIFQSGFSTTSQVSDISGRGVGMDIVRTQVRQLKGRLDVDTVPGQGTSFQIRLPLSLSLLSLLLCQTQQQVVAIPTDSVLDMLPYGDVQWAGQPSQVRTSENGASKHAMTDGNNDAKNGTNTAGQSSPNGAQTSEASRMILWRDYQLPLFPLISLLPYAQMSHSPLPQRVVLILNGPEQPLAITVDTIVDERQLILRSFDDTIPVPPYIAGCTILGTGQVVPVILPRYFRLSRDASTPVTTATSVLKTSRTLLIAEDSTGARRSLERILTQSGFIVVACRDGQEALEELQRRSGEVDLVISDVEMPRMTGFDLLQKIRTHSYWYKLPVIMLTSRTGDRHRQKATSLGANGYLGKPITPVELLANINQLLPANTKG